MKILLLISLVLATNLALADPKSSALICDELSASVEAGNKELSAAGVYDFFEENAFRETNRQLKMVVASNIIQSNLVLMQANKCQLPKTPVANNLYISNSLQCEAARSKAARLKEKDLPEECDRSKWVSKSK